MTKRIHRKVHKLPTFVFVKTQMRTQTDVHFLKVWETERNLHHKWLPLKITKETLTFERCFLPKAVLSNASLLYMTRSDVFVCEAERNKNICHWTKYISVSLPKDYLHGSHDWSQFEPLFQPLYLKCHTSLTHNFFLKTVLTGKQHCPRVTNRNHWTGFSNSYILLYTLLLFHNNLKMRL